MISAAIANVQYPLDTNQLYWLALGAARAGRYSPSSFFFASSDGTRLVPAMDDEARFIAALTDAIASSTGLQFVSGLQDLLNDLTTTDTVPAPVYPQPGDTGVTGQVFFVVRLTTYVPIPPVPPPWTNLPPIWVGMVIADIAANGYTTPPPYDAADAQFFFQFRSTTKVGCGQAVSFDIAQGKFAPLATNVEAA